MEVEMEFLGNTLDSVLPRMVIRSLHDDDDDGVKTHKDAADQDHPIHRKEGLGPKNQEIDDVPIIDNNLEKNIEIPQVVVQNSLYDDDPMSLYDVPASLRGSYPHDAPCECEVEVHNEDLREGHDHTETTGHPIKCREQVFNEVEKNINEDKDRGDKKEGEDVVGKSPETEQPSSHDLVKMHYSKSEFSPVTQYDVEKNTASFTNGKVPPDPHLTKSDGKSLPPISMESLDRKRHESATSQVSRGNWGSRWEFLLSCVGLSVGIGNIWRFPYLAYNNGGGAFLIPYLIMLLLVGKPMYFMELAFGQFASKGPLSIWKCAPISKGVGVAMVVVTLIICIYYNILMAYTIYYIASSFQAEVPWVRCDPEWADLDTCQVRNAGTQENTTTNSAFFEGPNMTFSSENISYSPAFSNKSQTPSQQYWERYVLGITDGIENIGNIKWDLALCLLLSWVIVVLCLLKGIKTSGKVVYFAATFPYIILIILLVAGSLQPGAADGILYFIIPKWEKLLEVQVWKAAAGQMFFSLSVSMGSLIMYSSYNPFRNNVYRDAMIVSVLDTFTSIIAGIVIFSVLGAMSKELDIPIDKIVQGGPGLAFVAYPEALSRLPVPQLWSVLFFFMLFILGLDSEFANFENIITSISDEFPILRKHKTKFCIGTAIFCFFLGLPCVTYGGQYIFQLMDEFGGSTSLIFIAVTETIGIMWIYGLKRFSNDVKFMLGNSPSWYLKITWSFFSPILLAVIFIYTLATQTRMKYGDNYTYPVWAEGIGWLLALVSMVQIPLFAIIAICKQPGPTLWAKIRQSAQPDPDWGPDDPLEKEEWLKQMPSGMTPPIKRSGLQSATSFNYINGSSEVFAITNMAADNPGFTP